MTTSIVVPVRDEGAVIEHLLAALQPARAAGHELIVVDGESADDTRERAVPHCDRLLVSPPGRARQLNAGARVAGGDWLWFLHADSGFPEGVMAALSRLSACEGGWGRFDVRLDDPAPVFRVIETAMNWRSRLTGIATGDQGIFVRRALFEQVGGFPEIPLMEDLALSERLRRHGWPACLRPPLHTSARRWRRHGVLRTVLLMWRLRLAWFLGADPAVLARRYASCSSPTRAS
ncbi:TIGR04283 family arsenosugar biosynthesis glycosyltransferase [endosymbiont of unidentified scaly snail isolate Monju]|uniref:TIGR04283 family arsenosugar biosynthesis glycosyltransferase n=1 Tax=endosymbiont of unidentified scaly snail isolate Monju TaxID=1248727 RepID=UPI0003892520|nr:TIGR04283 family arsenosugar biosynthesis glycosyltransferase [endosymbiont of unidentified scaly snail isolate Monju]BAN68556.1 glycosyl transferase family 2 [endosymbiont of unidentified scaly snail isolate Monju]